MNPFIRLTDEEGPGHMHININDIILIGSNLEIPGRPRGALRLRCGETLLAKESAPQIMAMIDDKYKALLG